MRHFYLSALLLISSITYSQQITLVKDINTFAIPIGLDQFSSSPAGLTEFNGKIYFAADDEQAVNTGGIDYGKELWVSDGTPEGTVLLKDLDGSSDSSSPGNFFELNNTLYFQATDPATNSFNIHSTDGTEAGTVSLGNNFQAGAAIIVGNKAYMRNFFTNGDGVFTGVFYEFDGTSFQELPDTGAGTVTATSNYMGLNDNSILFNMSYTIGGLSDGNELYLYDITNQNYTLVKNFDEADGNSSLTHMTKLGDDVYFEYDSDLWVTDGTTDGTTLISVASTVNSLNNLYAWEGKLYFEGDDGSRDQLWAYDPVTDTVTNLSGVTDTNPDGFNFNHDPVHFVAPGDGYLYYAGKSTATFATFGLYRTDGITVEPIEIDLIDNVDDIVVLNNKLYFEASHNTDNTDINAGIVDVGRELFTYTNDDLNTLTTSTFDLDNSFSIYPNPSTNLFNVQTTLEGSINYIFYDILGKRALSGTIENNVINHNLQSGMYLLKLDNGSVSTTKKVIIN